MELEEFWPMLFGHVRQFGQSICKFSIIHMLMLSLQS